MAHFAQLDSDNNVINVIVIDNISSFDMDRGCECEEKGINYCKSLFGDDTKWIKTSYNNNIRYNFAGVGYKYDPDVDAFIPPQPYPTWILNSSYNWEPPVPKPEDTDTHIHIWNEETQEWEQFDITTES